MMNTPGFPRSRGFILCCKMFLSPLDESIDLQFGPSITRSAHKFRIPLIKQEM